ncbi:MAG: 4-(cytidine 5'-diphospho)-2-C-methyl-D-erythritol kinase [Chloroflexi bacterium]|nr:4-(cytidine 5'-diphospho)-2-C-methyl-D-erythritol kinase [Chloroflexota bacterium]
MKAHAPAKINLCLEVLGKRPDGYHEIASVLHTLDLADELSFSPAEMLRLRCSPPVGPDEDNLVVRAARLLQEAAGCDNGAAIALTKRIPVAAGLGGGSSDAAATLRALNGLWGLRLSREALAELASRLGSDAPFFLEGGCALAEGKGERLTPLAALRGWWAVVLSPPIALEGKTAKLYGMLTPADYSDGSATRSLGEKLRRATARAEDLAGAGNVFERVGDRAFSGLVAYRQAFSVAGAPFVRLSGSGPSLFTLVESAEEAGRIAAQLRRAGHAAVVALLTEPLSC